MIIIYIIVLIYVLFILWILGGYKYLNNPLIKTPILNSSFISIVIAAKNEKNNIKNLLNSLKSQKFPKDKYEIIIINDKSEDDTGNILEKYNKNISYLKVIHIKKTPNNWASKKWALYQGIQKAKGDIIIQTDADCIFNKNWINSMIRPFIDADVGFVCSLAPLKGDQSIFQKLLLLDSVVQDALSACGVGQGIILSCTGRSMAYRKAFFFKAGGYDNIKNVISGDDDLILHKIVHYVGCKVKFIISKDASVLSPPPKNLKSFINQRLRFASKGLLYYKSDYISKELKMILPLLFLTNLMIIISIINFCNSLLILWIFPFIFKLIADFFILYIFQKQLSIRWDWILFLLLSIIHPFYIVIFGCLGPFRKFQWR